MTTGRALILAACLCAGGLAMLGAAGGARAIMLTLLGLAWYNGLYTPLKRRTAFAAVPGSLVGCVPLLIGWSGAGGSLADSRLWALCGFFCAWQIPHFWILALAYGEEYRKAGFPTIVQSFGAGRAEGVVLVWIGLAAGATLLLPLHGAVASAPASFVLAASALRLVWRSGRLLEDGDPAAAFVGLNRAAFLALVLTALG